MLLFALALFTFVALFGGIMALEIFANRWANWSFTRAHGLLAVTGALLVVVAYMQGDTRVLPVIALILVIAAVGFVLARFHANDKPQPRPLVLAHGGLAVVCYLMLANFALTPVSASPKALYTRLGGKEAITAVVGDFVGNVVADNRINRYFAKSNADRVKSQLVDFVCQGTGGPCTYQGKDMKAAHDGMQISSAEFDALAEDLVKSLDKFHVPPAEKSDLVALLGSMKNDVINR